MRDNDFGTCFAIYDNIRLLRVSFDSFWRLCLKDVKWLFVIWDFDYISFFRIQFWNQLGRHCCFNNLRRPHFFITTFIIEPSTRVLTARCLVELIIIISFISHCVISRFTSAVFHQSVSYGLSRRRHSRRRVDFGRLPRVRFNSAAIQSGFWSNCHQTGPLMLSALLKPTWRFEDLMTFYRANFQHVCSSLRWDPNWLPQLLSIFNLLCYLFVIYLLQFLFSINVIYSSKILHYVSEHLRTRFFNTKSIFAIHLNFKFWLLVFRNYSNYFKWHNFKFVREIRNNSNNMKNLIN